MKGSNREVARSITTYMHINYTYILIHSWNITYALNIYSPPIWKKSKLATKKTQNPISWNLGTKIITRFVAPRCHPVFHTCRSKGPPKPGSCSKELRPPLRIRERQGRCLRKWTFRWEKGRLKPKKKWYVYIVYNIYIAICTLAPFCFGRRRRRRRSRLT